MAVPATQTPTTETHAEHMARLEAEVQALHLQLRHAQRLATIGTMAAMVAHEFNNILTPIINYAHLARENPDLAEKALTHAAMGGKRASDICNAILGMTRGESTDPVDTPAEDIIRVALAAIARDPRKDAIDIAVDVEPGCIITASRIELEQVLLNLILNARTALLDTLPPHRIEITARREGDSVAIRIADNGMGIPPENLERIFEPFFTTRRPDGHTPGHGLGLAICREIIQGARGQITVESAVGVGTTFTVRIPD